MFSNSSMNLRCWVDFFVYQCLGAVSRPQTHYGRIIASKLASGRKGARDAAPGHLDRGYGIGLKVAARTAVRYANTKSIWMVGATAAAGLPSSGVELAGSLG